jgi:type I restriction enzyme S subunit
MNHETMRLLEQQFDTAFAAPDGIQKLRELILTLAIQGKLVPQDPNDQPASELLKAIEVEKKRLVKEGKIKQPKPLPEIKQEEVPHVLPHSWKWLRLGDFGIWKSGTTPSRTNSSYYGGEIPWVKSGEVKQGKIRETEEKITHEALQNCSLTLNPIGSILIAMYGANIGEAGVLEIEATTNQAVCACQTYSGIDNIFLLYLIVSLKQNFNAQGAGAAQPNISREKIIHTLAPLPPLAEQRRIVAKIDQLMARCDQLEKLRSDRAQKLITVHTAAIAHLLTAQDSHDFSTAWRFITQHFSELYSVKETVAELRKTILQLAVMGKLVPQDPNDEPASELLKEIELEKQRLVKVGKIKQSKPLPAIKREEVPYELPKGWKWLRLGNVGAFERGRSKHRPRNDKCLFDDGLYPFVQTGDVSRSKSTKNIINTCSSYYNDFGLQQSRLWTKGTLCITIAANIAETGFLGIDACIPDSVVAFLSIDESLSKLVKLFIDVAKQDLEHYAPSTAQKNINLGIINDLIFPLPPLAEQHRIVAKVDQLMALCDRLEAAISAAQAKQTGLLNAVMAQV